MTNERFTKVLSKAGISTRRVLVLGRFVHIDTYKKYETNLLDIMTQAKFSHLKTSDGHHMDGSNGFRMVFTAST